MTLAFENAAAADAIIQFRWVAQVPIVFEPPPDDVRVTLSMLDVPLEQALDALCRQIGYSWRRVGAIYVLTSAQRRPLLPTAEDLAERALYPERQRLEAARLMLSLTPSQIARIAQGDRLRYDELSPTQQALLGGIYRNLIAAARAGWLEGAERLSRAPLEAPQSLAFGIRGYVWRMEGAPTPVRQQPSIVTPAEPGEQPRERPPVVPSETEEIPRDQLPPVPLE